jgi:hypothetical protein
MHISVGEARGLRMALKGQPRANKSSSKVQQLQCTAPISLCSHLIPDGENADILPTPAIVNTRN